MNKRDLADHEKTSEAQYRALIEAANDAIFIADASTGVLVDANKKAEELIKRTRAEIIGMHQTQLHPGEEREHYRRIFEKYVLKGHGITREMVAVDRDGRRIPVEISASLVKGTGDRWFLQGIFRDLRARHRAKELSDALNSLGDVINSTLEFDQIMEGVISGAGKAVGADWGAIELQDGDDWSVAYTYGALAEPMDRPLLGEQPQIADLVEQNAEPFVVEDVDMESRIDPGSLRRRNAKALLAVPLLLKGELLGVIVFSSARAGGFSAGEVDFGDKLGASVSMALENARLYEEERNVSRILQQALLRAPTRIGDIGFYTAYRARTDVAMVGGDFYDFIDLGDDRAGFVVGDVSGSGLDAATLTSFAKNAVRAYALQGGSPAKVLGETNSAVAKTFGPMTLVTIFLAILDKKSRELTYCTGGHPPGLIHKSDGSVDMLEINSLAVGVFPDLEFRDSRAPFVPGDTLILFSDGVIEAACQGALYGPEGIIEVIERAGDARPQDLPDLILEDVIMSASCQVKDDMAVVAAVWRTPRPNGESKSASSKTHQFIDSINSIHGAKSAEKAALRCSEAIIRTLGVSAVIPYRPDPERGDHLNGFGAAKVGSEGRVEPAPIYNKVAVGMRDRHSLAATSFRDNRPLISNDPRADSRAKQWLVRLTQSTASLAVPIRAGGKPVGALVAIHTKPNRKFGPDDAELALKLGAALGDKWAALSAAR